MNHPGRTYKKDWTLAQDAFDKLLAYLDPDRERAGEKYERIREKLARFFKWRGCSAPEDYADRTIDRVARRVQEGAELRVSNPYLYFHGVALKILMEYRREPVHEGDGRLSSPAGRPAGTENPDDEDARLEQEQRLRCLDRCLDRLAPETRRLLLDYHEAEKRAKIRKRQALARTLGIPINALRIRVFRIRLGLEACTRQCMQTRGAEMVSARGH